MNIIFPVLGMLLALLALCHSWYSKNSEKIKEIKQELEDIKKELERLKASKE